MNLRDIAAPKQFWRLIEHHIVRPRIWQGFTSKRLLRLTDEEFLGLCPSASSADDFILQFHQQAKLKFFFHPRNQKDFFLNLLTKVQSFESILSEAQDVLDNKFQTLGSGTVFLGEKIHWQKDFKSGKAWPLEHKSRLDILDLANPSDVKVPWELSRFHQVWWLGKAYWITRNEQYPEKFRELIEDWVKNNPPGKGVNWVVAMEVAIRAANWIAGYYFFCESKALPHTFWLKFLKSLYAHGNFIENNLEYSWRNSNHFLSNVMGLAILGVFFQHTRFGRKWLQWAVEALPKEMEAEVYPDGVDYEKSTSYQRLVVDLFFVPTLLLLRNNIRLAQSHLDRLEKMFEYVQHYTRPDGSIPLFGDADDGRLFRFMMDTDINDHRQLLAAGAVFFERSDFARSAGEFSQDALWLFGGEGFEKFQRLKGTGADPGSRAFPHGGFYIMRNERMHVMVDAGDIGMKGWGGHGHNDVLSFEFWADGEPMIVDSGTYAYTFDVAARQEFRGIRAHNTIAIDGKEIASFVGLWMILKDNTRPRVHEWKTSADLDVLDASHYAYKTLSSPVVHRRRFELEKKSGNLRILDFLEGSGKHTVEGFLHCAPHVKVTLRDSRTAVLDTPKASYVIRTSHGDFSVEKAWFSRSYGVRERNKRLIMRLSTPLPLEIETRFERERDIRR